MVSNRSFVLANALGKTGLLRLNLAALTIRPLVKQLLDLPKLEPENGAQQFIVPPDVFLALEDIAL
jgi:hypothetical protein